MAGLRQDIQNPGTPVGLGYDDGCNPRVDKREHSPVCLEICDCQRSPDSKQRQMHLRGFAGAITGAWTRAI